MACYPDSEDFSEYEVVDSDANINLVDYCTFSFDSMLQSANSYAYKDYDEGYFGDFEHNFEFEITDNVSGFVSIWALDNGAGRRFWGHNIHDRQSTSEGLDLYIKEGSIAGKFSLFLIDYEKQMWNQYISNMFGQTVELDLNTTYYLRISRSLYPKYLNISIYDNYLRRDPIGNNPRDYVGKIGCYCNNTHYRYIVPLSSHQAQTGFSLVSGYVANLQIQSTSFSSSSSSSSSSYSSSSSSSSSRSSSSSSSSFSISSSSSSSNSSSSSSLAVPKEWILQTLSITGNQSSNICEYNGSIFAGGDYSGILYRWSDGGSWTMVANTYGISGTRPVISSLVVYNGNLYGMAGDEDYTGRLLVWNGIDAWNLAAPETGLFDNSKLIIFNGNLYGYDFILARWNGSNAWIQISTSFYAICCCVYNNLLYGMMWNGSENQMYVFDNINTWNLVSIGAEPRIINMVVFNGALYGGSSNGHLYKWNDSNAWVQIATTLSNLYGQGLRIVVHDGAIYGGCSGGSVNGQLWKFNGTDAWILELDQYEIGQTDRVSSIIERSTSGTIFTLLSGFGPYAGALLEASGV